MKRKILSLLMVFVLLCGMLPAALAEDDPTHTHKWKYEQKDGKHSATCTETDCSETISETECTASSTWQSDDSKHWKKCSVCDGPEKLQEADHDFSKGDCECGKTKPETPVTSLALSATTATIKVKGSTTLTATLSPSDSKVTWK